MNKVKILFVDDEDKILHSLRRSLRHEPYEFFYASQIKDVWQILQDSPIDIVCSDQRMPEIHGTDLLQQIQKEYPHTFRILITGFPVDESLYNELRNTEVLHYYLKKPFDLNDLKSLLSKFSQKIASS